MTEVGRIYGEALYRLAQEEGLDQPIGEQAAALQEAFRQAPDFLRLLSAPTLTKGERCQILEDSFHRKIHPYLLNFLKILVEKGYIRHFGDCCQIYLEHRQREAGILQVSVVTAVPLTGRQRNRLIRKLRQITGKEILLACRIDPGVLGGIRLDYDGQRLEDTVAHRMDSLRNLLYSDDTGFC